MTIFKRNKKKLIQIDDVTKKAVEKRMERAAHSNTEDLHTMLKTTPSGLHTVRIARSREQYGENVLASGHENTVMKRLVKAFINPFTAILIFLAFVSAMTDIVLAEAGEKDVTTVIIISVMVILSGLLRFIQETRSNNAAQRLKDLVETTCLVERKNVGPQEIPIDEVVVGDLIHLAAGDMIPADMRIVESKDLFITQSALTGESDHVEKTHILLDGHVDTLTEMSNLAFMGSDVISGTARGYVVAVGPQTLFGSISQSLAEIPEQTAFETGVNSVSWVLIRFMAVMVPIVFAINGITKGNWLEAFLFAISVAVGLTPEMLPMIVTTSLAKGAVAMSKEKTIVKNLNSIQNLGSMDVLCTDKTGTLTQNEVVLELHLDVMGDEDNRILKHAYLNSFYQTGLRNLMDKSIIKRTHEYALKEASLRNLDSQYRKVDEIPFDFNRRRMSVVVEDANRKTQMITKGAVEEMLAICSYADYKGEIEPLTPEMQANILLTVGDLNDKGMRVIALAQKTNPSTVGEFSVSDEDDMVLIGYLAFLDPPKDTAEQAIDQLLAHGVRTVVLTGDNDKVTRTVANRLNINARRIVLGNEIEAMSDAELANAVEEVDVFAKLAPNQKRRIVEVLRSNGHTVGFLGDGINDAPAMKAADIGISVDTGVDIAKESAEVILLEKDLGVLDRGIIEGRKTYANMIKYIKMTASSNFGNVFSVLVASAFLPFLPMAAIHLVFLNLIYDISCIAIPWDNVDEEFLMIPRKWDSISIRNFMLWIGPTSSVFDITTYLLMFFVISPLAVGGLQFHQITDPKQLLLFVAVFQSGWFIESMWTQTLVIHMIRTPKIPFLQSRASTSLTLLTFFAIGFLTVIPSTAFGASIGLTSLPFSFYPWLLLTVFLYMILASMAKNYFIRRYGELL